MVILVAGKEKEHEAEVSIDPREISQMNIGMIGHVDHGKTTLTEALTGKFTDEHSEELKRGISIRLGYADFTIRKCPKCDVPQAYTVLPVCFYCGSQTEPVKTASIVDCPGHETLMATTLTGAALMDYAILVIAANEPCPKPQTVEHFMAAEIAGIEKFIVVQNKIDLVDEEQARENYRQIREFLKGTKAENAPIIPVSAQLRANIDVLLYAIDREFPAPKRDLTKSPLMYVARSFDVNKPGTSIEKLVGGVLGGSIMQGKLKVGDEIEIRPGIRGEDGRYHSVITEITSLMQGNKRLEEATPGGLVAIGTLLDPAFTKADAMVGNIIGHVNELPPVYYDVVLEYHPLERILESGEKFKVERINPGTPLLMNVGTARTVGVCTKGGSDTIEAKLKLPICAQPGSKIALSMQIDGRWRLVGYGVLK